MRVSEKCEAMPLLRCLGYSDEADSDLHQQHSPTSSNHLLTWWEIHIFSLQLLVLANRSLDQCAWGLRYCWSQNKTKRYPWVPQSDRAPTIAWHQPTISKHELKKIPHKRKNWSKRIFFCIRMVASDFEFPNTRAFLTEVDLKITGSLLWVTFFELIKLM